MRAYRAGLVTLLSVGACIPPAAPLAGAGEAGVPADFSFVFDYGVCVRHRYDAARSRFTVSAQDRQRTARATLTAEEVRAVYDAVEAADLWAYPEVYRLVPRDSVAYYVDPHPSYALEVQRGGETKRVAWADPLAGGSVTAEGAHLRALARLLEEIIGGKEAVQRLPRPPVWCL